MIASELLGHRDAAAVLRLATAPLSGGSRRSFGWGRSEQAKSSARDALREAVAILTAGNQSQHTADNGEPGGVRWLLSAGVDCCESSLRLCGASAMAYGGFDRALLLSRDDYDPAFTEEYGAVLLGRARGAGYWVWKPYFLLRAMLEKATVGDWIFYSDAGTILPRLNCSD
jgi:hypothetical protein